VSKVRTDPFALAEVAAVSGAVVAAVADSGLSLRRQQASLGGGSGVGAGAGDDVSFLCAIPNS
jgi:hypothetical protein